MRDIVKWLEREAQNPWPLGVPCPPGVDEVLHLEVCDTVQMLIASGDDIAKIKVVDITTWGAVAGITPRLDRSYDFALAMAVEGSEDHLGAVNKSILQSLYAIWGARPIAFA